MAVAGLIFGLAAAILAVVAFGAAGAAFARVGRVEKTVEELRARVERHPPAG